MIALSLRGVGMSYGHTSVLDQVNLDVLAGQYCVLVGESGSGKSTLLKLVAGLIQPTSGEIAIGGQSMRGVAPRKRSIAMLFQDDRLYPHWNVRRSLEHAATQASSSGNSTLLVSQMAERFQITECLDRKPETLSGGQCRRAALAGALLRRPAVCLLDEPLTAIDRSLKEQLIETLQEAPRDRADGLPPTAFLHITHDGVEAMRLADQIAVLGRSGEVDDSNELGRSSLAGSRILQTGTPHAIYQSPNCSMVAKAVGSPPANMCPMDWLQRFVPNVMTQFVTGSSVQPNNRNLVMIRPESIALTAVESESGPSLKADGDRLRFRGLISNCRFVGDSWHVRLQLAIASPTPTDSSSDAELANENFAKEDFGNDPAAACTLHVICKDQPPVTQSRQEVIAEVRLSQMQLLPF